MTTAQRIAFSVLFISLAGCGESSGDEAGTGTSEATGETTTGAETTGDGDGATATSDTTSSTTSTDTTSTGDGDGDTTTTTSTTGDGDGDGDGDLPDFEQPGPFGVSSQTGSMTTTNGCDLDFEIFTPATSLSDATVFMAHGFMRSVPDQGPMASHAASFGVTVVTVSLCTNGFVGVDHQRNGEAIAQLGQAMFTGDRVYTGFSAGGLAAFVAAATDPGATGFVGLDPVDNGTIGADAAVGFSVPILAAIAEPGQCNTNNNFVPVFATLDGSRVVRVVGAGHFDYEQETCAGLECSFCAPVGGMVHSMARGMVASGIGIASGAYPGATAWWYAGNEPYNTHQAAGRIEAVQ